MSITKMLLDVVNDMRSFADSVEVLAQAICRSMTEKNGSNSRNIASVMLRWRER